MTHSNPRNLHLSIGIIIYRLDYCRKKKKKDSFLASRCPLCLTWDCNCFCFFFCFCPSSVLIINVQGEVEKVHQKKKKKKKRMQTLHPHTDPSDGDRQAHIFTVTLEGLPLSTGRKKLCHCSVCVCVCVCVCVNVCRPVLQYCSVLRHVAHVARGACREMEGCRRKEEDGWMAASASVCRESRCARARVVFCRFTRAFPSPGSLPSSPFVPFHLFQQIFLSRPIRPLLWQII